MHDQIERILAERQRQLAGNGRRQGIVLAILLHLAVVLAVIVSPGKELPEPMEIVAVNIVPLQALGTRQPRPAPTPKPAAPEPVKPEPEPEPPEPEPDPEPTLPDPEPTPRDPAPSPPRPEPARPEPQAQTTPPQDASSGPAQREGSARGSAFGSSAFGAEVAGIDSDFKHDYYVNRMLAMIHAQWVRPAVGEIRTTLTFTIRKNGEISDLQMTDSSGHNGFDLAAQRAVRNASPLLPLPASYRKDQLTVTLIVR